MMRIFRPDATECKCAAVPIDGKPILIEEFMPLVDWDAPTMEIAQRDGRRRLEYTNFPYIGYFTIGMTRPGMEALRDLVAEDGEIVSLSCVNGELWMLHVTRNVEAIDLELSEFVTSDEGRIMFFNQVAFYPEIVAGLSCFRDTRFPRWCMYMTEDFVRKVAETGLTDLGAAVVWEAQ